MTLSRRPSLAGNERNAHLPTTALFALVVGTALGALAPFGCSTDRYEVKQDANGRTIRLDKRTGEMVALVGDTLVLLSDPAQRRVEAESKRKEDSVLALPHRWHFEALPNIGVDSAFLTTVYRDDALHYRLSLQPVPRGYEAARRTKGELGVCLLILQFIDSSGMQLIKTDVCGADVTNEVDNKGRQIGLEFNGITVLPHASDYRDAKYWSVLWRF